MASSEQLGHVWEVTDDPANAPNDIMWCCSKCGNYYLQSGNRLAPYPEMRRTGRTHQDRPLTCEEIQLLEVQES